MIKYCANLLSALLLVLTACASDVSQPDVGGGQGEPGDLSSYFISPALCADEEGPECASLRLGDPHLTTTSPARGKLFACSGGNPNAPGSDQTRITWIDWAAGTWNLLTKPFLPSGSFSPGEGVARVSESDDVRSVVINNLPVDEKIGDWPMTKYPELSAIDRNPGVPAARSFTFNIPIEPVVNETPFCTSLGAIGVTLNGVVLYNAVDARGNDAVAHEIVDEFGGHPAMSDYHYHFLPERLDSAPMADGHSGLVGFIRDGFGLYGYDGSGGLELTNADLDECHGHDHAPMGYHYHATIEYPYTIGCFRGDPEPAFLASTLASESGADADVVPEVDTQAVLPFLERMISHHLQALELTALVPDRSDRVGVRQIAERMRIAQAEEIRLMEYWLQNEISSGVIGDSEEVEPVGMPGMLSPERMQRLRGLEGREFDRLFLRSMVEHHQGAVRMAGALLQRVGPAARGSSIDWFVLHLEAEQAFEVKRMLHMLDDVSS